MEQFSGPTGHMALRIWRRGVLIEDVRLSNMIVGGSRFIHAQLLGGVVLGNSVTQVGFGSNTAAPGVGNTALSVDAYLKGIDAIFYPAPNQVSFSISLGEVEANGLVLAEYGLITEAGALYARLVRTAPVIKDASITIKSTWTVTF